MMSQTIRAICFLTLLSCVNHHVDNYSPRVTLTTASVLCKESVEDMQWLKALLQNMEKDMSLQGDIYAVPISGRIIFVHQPMVMSCFACVLYDCDGHIVPSVSIDHETLRQGMSSANRIYSVF